MTKKQVMGVFFIVCLVFSMLVLWLQLTPNTQQRLTSNESYTVITSNYSGVSYDLYCPTESNGSLVIFAGGILGHKRYLAGWAPILAERGYAVLTFTTPAEDLNHVSRYVHNCKNNIEALLPFVFDDDLFPISINPDCVSIVGMSGGGATVLAFEDSRIQTTVAICPYYIDDSSVDHDSPVLIITGSEDNICPHDTHGLVYYDEIEPSKMIWEQADVGHDMSPAAWELLVEWLNCFGNSDDNDCSMFMGLSDDSGFVFTLSDFSNAPMA
jgi:hypothetical protein